MDIQNAAELLLAQHKGRELYFLEDNLMPSDLNEAYKIQREYQRLASKNQGAIGGYKLALTSPATQARNGVYEPCLGIILQGNIRNAPSTLKASDYVELNLECEVAVRLGSDLPAIGAPYDLNMVSQAVESVSVALEMLDNRRFPGNASQTPFLTIVASNIFNEGVVIGDAVSDWRSLDLQGAHGYMEINGKTVGEGHGSEVMGHPLEPLAWLANALANQGIGLSAGLVIITGAFFLPKQVRAGDNISAVIDGLGEAKVTIL